MIEEFDKKEQRNSDEVDAFVEVDAPGPDPEVRTKGKRKSPLIADMPTPTVPVTQVRVQRSYTTLSQAEDKKKKEDLFSCNRNPKKQFLFDFRTIRKKKWLKESRFSTIGRENFLKPVQKEN